MEKTAEKIKILICGRGNSLERIDHSNLDIDFDHVILINEFNLFVKENQKIHNFLKNKKIIQQVNICESGLDHDFVNNFNVQEVYIARLRPDGNTNWWRTGYKGRNFESLYKIPYNYHSDSLEKYMNIVENSSDMALLHAALELKADEIYVIGIDFYETEYFLGHNEADPQDEIVSNKIKNSHKTITSLFPEILFHYFTYSSFDPGLKNLKVCRF